MRKCCNVRGTYVKPVSLPKSFNHGMLVRHHHQAKETQLSRDDDESDYISFTMWIREDKKIKKVTKCLEQKEFYNGWEQMVFELKEHIHRKRIYK